jgi:integrase
MPKVRDIREYLGDSFLEDLIKECDKTPHKGATSKRLDYLRNRDKAIVATIFLTGGYVREVLSLRKRNFDFEDKEAKRRNAFLVKGMKVVRHREEQIFYADPLVQYLFDWLKLLPEEDDQIFRLEPVRVEEIIRDLGKRMNFPISPLDLRNQRGLYLVEKRGFDSIDVQRYLGMDLKTPAILEHLSATGKRKRIRYMSRLRVALVILCDAMLLITVILLLQIDQIVNGTLYNYGLDFSSDWAQPYWLLFRVSLVLIVAAVFLISIVELPHPAFQEDQA